MKYLIYIISIVSLIYSCSTDDENLICVYDPPACEWTIPLIPYQDTCYDLPPTPSSGWVSVATRQGFGQTSFNPENSHSFLFGTEDTLLGSGYYWVDLCKSEKYKIIDGTVSNHGRPRWGQNDWLVYTTHGQELMAVKTNGDSLTAIASEINCKYPSFIGPNKIIVLAQFPDNIFKTAVFNLEGELLDSISPTIIYSEFNGKIATSTGLLQGFQIGYKEVENNFSFTPLYNIPDESFPVLSVEWLNEELIIWTDKTGIHKVDLFGNKETLRENCENRTIGTITVNPALDGTILFEELHFTPQSDTSNILYTDVLIYHFDTNTGVMQELSLDGI